MSVKEKATAFKDKLFTNNSVTPKEQWGYAGGIFGNCMGQDCIGTYDDKFCRDFMGINSSRMLLKENITTILSFIIPPIAGAWYDSPAKGKRSHIRTALLTTPIPFAITSLLLFVVPTGNALYNFIWSLFLGIVFRVADTFYDIALAALGLRICSDPRDRKSFFTFSTWASNLGSMLPGWVIPIIVGSTDDANREKWLYFLVALVFCILGVTSMYAPYMTIKEKADMNRDQLVAMQPKEEEVKVQWNRETLSAIFHNRPFMVLQISMVCDMIRQITYKALPYLYEDVFDNYGMKAVIDAISGAFSYVGLAAVPFISSRVSARNIVAGGYAYTGFMYVIMSLFNIGFDVKKIRARRYIVGVLIGLAGMPNAAQGAARKIITADSTDYMEWYGYKHFDSSVRSDGMLTAAGNIVTKVVDLAKGNLYNILFGVIGYKEGDASTGIKPVQSDATLKGIFMMITLCGLIGNVLSGATFLFDNYTGERKEAIFAELVQMRKAKEKELETV